MTVWRFLLCLIITINGCRPEPYADRKKDRHFKITPINQNFPDPNRHQAFKPTPKSEKSTKRTTTTPRVDIITKSMVFANKHMVKEKRREDEWYSEEKSFRKDDVTVWYELDDPPLRYHFGR